MYSEKEIPDLYTFKALSTEMHRRLALLLTANNPRLRDVYQIREVLRRIARIPANKIDGFTVRDAKNLGIINN